MSAQICRKLHARIDVCKGKGGLYVPRESMIQLIFIVFCLCNLASGQETSFQFYQFSNNGSSLSLLGDAYVGMTDLALELTQNSTGRAVYINPIPFTDPVTQSTISFTTSFIFSIESDDYSSNIGEGLAFLIAPDNTTIGSGGPWLGLLAPSNDSSTATPNAQSKLVAVEFDVHRDIEFWDISDNHVGIDVHSLNSVLAKDAASGSQQVSLLSGHIKAWIEYDGQARKIQVSITPYAANNDYPKPVVPLLISDLDLSGIVNQYMYVGFSAATGTGTVRHKVWSWMFESTTLSGTGGFAPAPYPSDATATVPASGAFRLLTYSHWLCLAVAMALLVL